MFDRLGHFIVRHRKGLLASYIIAVLFAGGVGSGMFGALKSQGYDNPGSDSAKVQTILTSEFNAKDPDVTLIIDTGNTVDSENSSAIALAIGDRLKNEVGVDAVTSYWSLGHPASLRSTDGNAGITLVYFKKDLTNASAMALAEHIQNTYDNTNAGATTYVGGLQVLYNSINTQITKDLAKAESIAIPLNILMLLIIFGTAIAAGLPMIVALGSVTGSFLVIYIITQFTDVSVFALNLITGLGLGLGIDYALLIVNRFREELAATNDVEASVAKTVATAGRTVFFSGLTVALVLASLNVFPLYFLKSFGYAGVSVVIFAVFSSLIALPAVLALLGKKINKMQIRRGDLTPKDDGAWATLASKVMKRPIGVIVGTLVFMGLFAAPALNAQFSQVDDRVLPASNKVAIASQVSRDRFEGQVTSPLEILIPQTVTTSEISSLTTALSALQGVDSVTLFDVNSPQSPTYQQTMAMNSLTTAPHFSRITVVTTSDPRTPESQALVTDIRALSAVPAGTLVGGAGAVYTDSQVAISDRLGIIAAWLAIATFVLLFLFTGSILLPLKAIALNIVSLSATVGLLTWVFQYGHLQWLTGKFTVTGTIDTSMMVLIAIVSFGLSMDYELFLLSRIKEEHDHGADTETSVRLGLQRSGRIITSAAILIALVFFCFLTSGVTNIKMLGLGVAFAILVDATVVRGLLVPALMRVAGEWNWWAPGPLRRLHSRFGITD